MKSLLELEQHECRFPVLCVGEGEGFCAEHVEGVDSYCARHRALAGGARCAQRAAPVADGLTPRGSLRGAYRTDAQKAKDAAMREDERSLSNLRSYEHEPDLLELFGVEQ